MRIARLIAAAAVAVGGLGLAGCQSDSENRHAEGGTYDSQRMNDPVPSGSPSTGSRVGSGTAERIYPDEARVTGARTDVDHSGAVVRPADGVPSTTSGAAGRATGLGTDRTAAPRVHGTNNNTDDAAAGTGGAAGTDTGAGAGLRGGASVGAPAGTGTDRPTDTTRRVPNLEPGDRGAAPAGSGTRGTSGPGLNDDGIRRGSGGGGNDTRD